MHLAGKPKFILFFQNLFFKNKRLSYVESEQDFVIIVPPPPKKKKISFTVSGFDGQKCEEKLKEFRETLGLV